jgi:alpha-mannosidase
MLVDAKTLGKISILEKTYNDLRYFNVSHLETEYAQTFEHFRNVFDSDRDLEWKSISGGDRWGESWLSAWFRVKLTLPVEYAGGPVFLRAQTGATEALMIVNGKHMGVFDYNHPVHLVDMNPGAGQVFDIYLEGYSGHTFPGTQPYDRSVEAKGGEHQDSGLFVGKNCRVFQSIDLVSERKDVSEFVFKLQTLRQLANALDSNSLRRGQIQKALQQVFILVDAKPEETDESVWRPKISEAVKILNPLLALKNGPSAPKAGITGHSHIDTAWLWPIAETERKLARTFSSVLSLMEQYPEFRFTQSAAFHGDVVRRKYPEIFERIKQRVAEGRWEINGAMWVEPDCNISGGEALVRQCLYGQLATREMFGVTSDTLWQPDAFGFSGALPQILKGCGVKYFCTTKMGWNDTNRFPYETFIWEGVDGSSVLSHFNISHCIPDPETLINAWNSIQHKDIQDRGFVAFGYGDGGGGPMAEMIEMARLAEDLEGCPRASYSSVSEFMSGIENDFQDLPTWKGELYLELHRGTLTSVSEVKRLNRKSELALQSFRRFSHLFLRELHIRKRAWIRFGRSFWSISSTIFCRAHRSPESMTKPSHLLLAACLKRKIFRLKISNRFHKKASCRRLSRL